MFAGYKTIDLTLTLSESLPCAWPAHMPFQRKNWNWYSEVVESYGVEKHSKYGPYYTEWLTIDEHTGTHFDAPSHYIPHPDSGFKYACSAGKITGEKVDVSKLLGPAVVVDVTQLTGTGGPGESPLITVEHLHTWEGKYGKIQPGEIVLFYTGWDKYYLPGKEGLRYSFTVFQQEGPGWPSPDSNAVDWLYERGVRCIGTDGVSIGAAHEGITAHVAGLSKEMAYVESLTNLGQLPVKGFYFIFLPIKVEGSSGAPGRAVALVPDTN
ncbi:cyclase family protein [Alicyclobacillus tolerans]|uniref:cyclase family protein n=1 Tax=Alicyclobacillus tolerans TaxID=90970 RepID=UPI001F27542C|nr:cyclase family protein [Alicyclobacillus tolerans]MCF8568119.1 cyclase family protein [Alicyclobacillus tolerans]